MAETPKVKTFEKSLVGACGVFFVSAELSRRGWMAMPTIRNTAGIDIIAKKGVKSIAIQVKTNSYGQTKYPMNKNSESEDDESLYYVFVTLKSENERADFYIVPSKLVASYIEKTHKHWANLPPGQKRVIYEGMTAKAIAERRENSTLRQFPNHIGKLLPEFKDFKIENYKDQWEMIEK